MTHKRNILLILLVTAAAFGNTLTNDFIGDSRALFANNSFYKKAANLPKLFSADLIMPPEQLEISPREERSFSGCISYRPVPALTFFIDYFIWGTNPVGHHLSNILMHLTASVLVYFLALQLLAAAGPALFAALLFASHPIQSEVVSCIGYRSDLLATIFYLLTILSFIRFRLQGVGRKKVWLLALAYSSYLLALFSKESALTLLPVLILYDVFFLRKPGVAVHRHLTSRFPVYGGFILLSLFYLYVYFVRFPNVHYARFLNIDGNFEAHLGIVLKIFFEYCKVLLVPFTVTILPPLYSPPIQAVTPLVLFVTILIILGSLISAAATYKRQRMITFCTLWFFMTYFPAANIVPLPNPLAFRFMYLPSVGFFVILAFLLTKAARALQARGSTLNWPVLIPVILVAANLSATIPNNAFFKSNFTSCREMIRNYPDSSRPYWLLGQTYYDMGKFDQARWAFEKYLHSDPRNPSVSDPRRSYLLYHSIGRCYVGQPEKAMAEFQKALALHPNYLGGYLDAAQAAIYLGQYAQGAEYALAAIQLDDQLALPYVYAAHCYIELRDFTNAKKWLDAAQSLAADDPGVQYVTALFDERTKGNAGILAK